METDRAMSRVWLEVDEDALIYNYRLAKSLCKPETAFICVVKANAYGLGLSRTVKTLYEAGADWFATATAEEALAVRRALPDAHILVMGAAESAYLGRLIAEDISVTVNTVEEGRAVSKAAEACGKPAKVHIKLDTGLHRLGFCSAEEALPMIGLPGFFIEGIYSHLALRSREQSKAQFTLFMDAVKQLKNAGARPQMLHLLDSIGLTRYPEWQLDAVRVGAFLYGNVPVSWERYDEGRAVAALKARVTRVAVAAKGEGVGYDDTPLERDTLVATLAAGYVDGYSRALSKKGYVMIHGQKAPVLGLVCMDQMMVDVTDIPGVKPGDTATLLGGGISLREYAALGNLNRNESLAMIGRRVPRIYLRQGKIAAITAEM